MMNPSGDCVTYNTLIGDKSKVEDLSCADRTRRLKRLSPNKGIYMCLIDSLCKLNLIEEAYGVLNQMIVSGFSPSFATMNDVLRRFIGIGKMRKAYEMHIEHAGYATPSYHHWMDDDTESLLYEGLSDEVTYTSLMNAYLDEGNWDNAVNLFYEMKRLDKRLYNDEMPHCSHICTLPDDVKYSVFINGLDYKSRTTEIKKELLKFNYILFEGSADRPILEYRHTLAENSSLDEFKRVVKLVEGFCIKGLENVFDTLLNSNKPDGIDDGIVYNLSIIEHCKRNNVDKAYNIYKEMVNSGFACHMFTVFALITTLEKEKMVNELRWVIQNIPRSCNLNGCEIVKFLNECNPEELDIEALFD
ncbi:hypothetical protein P8452_44904 [Trifolium repens]|jgi:pentatricopeptide repeat protein|nr:pentatricopeptide repeat-containing protein [Trifolium repens]WJX59596.1 hypothetical protein P8452_44904 [Trifolium repens]